MEKVKEKYIHLTSDNTYRVQIRPSQKIRGSFDQIYKTLKEAIDNRDRFLAKQKLGIDLYIDKNITFEDFCDKVYEWYKNKPKKPSPHTLRDYKNRMKPLKRYFGKRPFYKITTDEIETFLQLESERDKINPSHPDKKTKQKISSGTLHHEYVMLRILFNKGVHKWKLRSDNPMDGVEEPTIKLQKEVQHIPYEEFENVTELIEEFASLRDKALFYLGLCGGLREEEVCGIHCEGENDLNSDIDFKTNSVNLRWAIKLNPETGKYEEYEILKSKTSERRIPLPDIAMNSIKKYLKYRDQLVSMFKFKYGDEYKNLPNLFLNSVGDYFRPPYVGKLWSKFSKKHNIDTTFHGLRHTYITYQMNYNDNLSPSEVQALAGHANITTTYKYVHKSDEKMKKAVSVFDDVYNNQIDINANNMINAPIMFVASIVNGIDYVDINQIIKLLKVVNPRVDITYGNLSSQIDKTRKYLLDNYPSLHKMPSLNEKYDRRDFEDRVRSMYGNKLLIKPLNRKIEYEMC